MKGRVSESNAGEPRDAKSVNLVSYLLDILTSSTLCSNPWRGGVAVDVVEDISWTERL